MFVWSLGPQLFGAARKHIEEKHGIVGGLLGSWRVVRQLATSSKGFRLRRMGKKGLAKSAQPQ